VLLEQLKHPGFTVFFHPGFLIYGSFYPEKLGSLLTGKKERRRG